MNLLVLLIVAALVLALVGLFTAAKWLLIVAVVLAVVALVTNRRTL